MIKKLIHFFKDYKQLGFVVVSILAGLVLDLTGKDTAAHWVLGLSAAINLIPLIWGMIQDLRNGIYGVDILAATAIATSVILHEYWAGMVIVLMLTGGEALEDYAERRAKTELSSLLSRKPKKAHLIRGTQTIDVNVKDIQAGNKLTILPGEVVPVDCVILEGTSSFDESSLTGESLPVEKGVDDELLSGSVNIEGAITVKALRSAADSQYEQIIKLVRSAAASQAPFVRLADRYSIPFTAVSFIIGGAAWFISGQAVRFLEVLVVATPCPLILGAPIALISGMSRATKHGIIVKTGSAMERLAEVKTVAFDKTGTLTRGIPEVDSIKTYNKFNKNDVLGFAAALEQNSNHILATAIINAAVGQNIKLQKAKKVKELAGHGLNGRLGGHDVIIGRLSLLGDQNVELPKAFNPNTFKHTTTFVAVDSKLAGAISFVDKIREEAKATLERLKKAGITHTLMVTGDNPVTAQNIAKQLGITDVQADSLPGDKIMAIEKVRDRPVAFAGDGVNDAPVLTAADVGIALGARGSTAASESADVVVMMDDLSKVASSIEIAKRTFFIANQSILIGIALSLGLMAVFATGRFKPVYGAAIQELVDVTVIVNALRAHGSFKRVNSKVKS
jgi:heavy metal translocating P-type ATPase